MSLRKRLIQRRRERKGCGVSWSNIVNTEERREWNWELGGERNYLVKVVVG